MDMSLDDIISTNKGGGGGGRGGKKFGRGASFAKRNLADKRKTTPYSIPKRNPDEPWRHDMYEGADLRERLSSGPARTQKAEGASSGISLSRGAIVTGLTSRAASSALRAAGVSITRNSDSMSIVGSAGGPSKITVANLHPDASAEDVQVGVPLELLCALVDVGILLGSHTTDYQAVFAEFGAIQQCSLSRDAAGQGFAEILYDNRKSSLAAIEKYNNKIADGKTLKVTEVPLGLSIAGAAKTKAPVVMDPHPPQLALIVVGSTNRAKIASVEKAIAVAFYNSPPEKASETLRAHGVQGKQGVGTSARYELSPSIMDLILNKGKELADIMDDMTGTQDVRHNAGAMDLRGRQYSDDDDDETEDLDEFMSSDDAETGLPSPSIVPGIGAMMLASLSPQQDETDPLDDPYSTNYSNTLSVDLRNNASDKSSTPGTSPLVLPPEISRAIQLVDSEDAWKELEKEVESFETKTSPASKRTATGTGPKGSSSSAADPNGYERTGSQAANLLKHNHVRSPNDPVTGASKQSSKTGPLLAGKLGGGPPQIMPRVQSKREIVTEPLTSPAVQPKPSTKSKTKGPIVIPTRNASHTYTKDDFAKYKAKYQAKYEAEELSKAPPASSSTQHFSRREAIEDKAPLRSDIREDARNRLETGSSDSNPYGRSRDEARQQSDRNFDRPSIPVAGSTGKTLPLQSFSTKSLPRNFNLEKQRKALGLDDGDNGFKPRVFDYGDERDDDFEDDSLDPPSNNMKYPARITPDNAKEDELKAYRRKPSIDAGSTINVPPRNELPTPPKKQFPRKTTGIVLYDASQQALPTNESTNFFAPLPSSGTMSNASSPSEKPMTSLAMLTSVFSMFSGGSQPTTTSSTLKSPELEDTEEKGANAGGDGGSGSGGTLGRSNRRAPPPTQLIITPKPHREPRESFLAPVVSASIHPPETKALDPRGRSASAYEKDPGRGKFEIASDSDESDAFEGEERQPRREAEEEEDEEEDEPPSRSGWRAPPPTTVANGFKVSVERANKRNSFLRRSSSNPELAKAFGGKTFNKDPEDEDNEVQRGRTLNVGIFDPKKPKPTVEPTLQLSSRTGSDTNLNRSTPTLRKPLKSALKAPRKPTEEEIRIADEAERNIEYYRNLTLGRPLTSKGVGGRQANRQRASSVEDNSRGGFSELDDEPALPRIHSLKRLQQSSSIHVKGVIDREHIVAVIVARDAPFSTLKQKLQDKIAATGHGDQRDNRKFGARKPVIDTIRRKDESGNIITVADDEDWIACISDATDNKVVLFLEIDLP
ncbi:hypothetical protein HDU96_004220 [Phlyctochytrium bullatum]|nr:hypothetical protein HDU96_004220 [Phlyctochytrium bullatum]